MFKVLSLCFTCVLLLTSSHSLMAATVAEEQQRLAALQQSLRTERAELQEMKVELETYPEKLLGVQKELMRAEQELATAQAELEAVKTAGTERDISLKEHAVRMAERRVRSENRMMERYTRYQTDLQDEVAATEKDIAELEQRIGAQQGRIAAAQEAARKPAPKPAPAPEAPAALPVEVERVVAETPVPEAVPEVKAEADEETEQAPVLSASDYEAFQTAKSAMEKMEAKLANAGSGGPRLSKLELSGSSIENASFTHLGADQYRAEAVLPSGRHLFRIDSLRFRTTISPDNAGETYVFLVDASDRAQLKASYFKKSLLAYLGTEPVRAVEVASAVVEEQEEAMEEVTLASGKTVQMSEDDAYALELAREHSAVLRELAQEGKGQPYFSSLTLSGNQMETTEFEHLGQDHYRAEVKVQAGRQNIKINRSTFRINIPEADEGESYLFFVDASRPIRLQVTYYKKSILDYL